MVYLVKLGFLLLGGFASVKNCLASDCPHSGINPDSLPHDKFINYLTDPCRYDKRMSSNDTNPFDVNVKMTVMHMEAKKSIYTIHLAVQFDYLDKGLEFGSVSPSRSVILGDESLKKRIWTPNIFMKDSKGSSVLGSQQKHIIISIKPTGKVTYSYKMAVTFDCFMKLRKYPFDHQECTIAFSEWSYDNSHVHLIWDKKSPLKVLKPSFNEYVLDEVIYSAEDSFNSTETGFFIGNFEEITLTFKFHRHVGFYLCRFFLPSYLLVFIAWATFWLRADAVSPRGTLGTLPTVAFFLVKLGVPTDIPKVSYFKASDLWFLGTFMFAFLSLAEFAFSNVIWRRRKEIQLKKNNNKYMAKSAFMPRKARNDLRKYESSMSVNGSLALTDSSNESYKPLDLSQESINGGNTELPLDEAPAFTWTIMTPQELSVYVDRQARIVFPIAFLIFNVVYWIFVYIV